MAYASEEGSLDNGDLQPAPQKFPSRTTFMAEGFIGLPMASASVARAAPHRPLLTRAANPQ